MFWNKFWVYFLISVVPIENIFIQGNLFENVVCKMPNIWSRLSAKNYTATFPLAHWGRETHICIGNLAIIGSDNGLSPGQRQAIIWTNNGLLLLGSLGTHFNEIWNRIQQISLKKIHLKMSSEKCLPSCLGLNVLTHCGLVTPYGNRDLRQHWLR